MTDTQCSARCGYHSHGKDLDDHERYEHADCPHCGAKAPSLDENGEGESVTHLLYCPRLAWDYRYENEDI